MCWTFSLKSSLNFWIRCEVQVWFLWVHGYFVCLFLLSSTQLLQYHWWEEHLSFDFFFHFQQSQLSYLFIGSVLGFFIFIDENVYLFASTGFPNHWSHKVSWLLERMIFPVLRFCQDCFSCSRMSILQSNFMVNSGYLQKQYCCFESNCIKPINYFKE